MEKSAVEWFADRIKHGGLVTKKQFNELLDQAKEMEAQQKGYSEDQVKQAITNFYMNDLLLTEENLTKVINNLKQEEQ
jgi:hypothetical protein